MLLEVNLDNESDTDELGRLLALHLPTRCVVALDGTLGAGKTRLTQAIAKACDIPFEEVTSPTFTLWQTYHGTRTIHHLDAYRIQDEDEFDALGVEECFDSDTLVLIEWARRIENCLPRDGRLSVELEVIGEQQRVAKLEGATFDALFDEIKQSRLTCRS